ncbi:MAG: hypothetical protein J1E59_01335 [Treponema sp.]|nr:hypothetical protein [Treponema sp.]
MKKIIFLGIFFVAIFLVGCQNGSEEETYTVWTDISTADDFQQTFGTTLYDGKYITVVLLNSQFSAMTQILEKEAAEFKHNWTEEELQKYFVGRGFDSQTASKTVAWLVTVNHGFVASRTGNIVYYILK